ncbi:unnamed protein product [Phytophthora fragariaefolia]|uniref:Unnamed protein product n=1 Tax=Phytophthora fragariaefolia TaxID=1490495 RepID=A0A9W6TMW6_9STRA|nr:unnamed protein product [Phytophthora fragariaefolia]
MSKVPIPRLYVTSTKELQSLLAGHKGKPVLSKAKVVGVHFQFAGPEDDSTGVGTSDSDAVVAFASGSNSPDGMAVVLQLERLGSKQVVAGLKALLEDSQTIKVMMDVGRVGRWLRRYGLSDVQLKNCVDLQLLYQHRVDPKVALASLTQISTHYGSSVAKLGLEVDAFPSKLKPRAWLKSPLDPPLLRHLVDTVKTLVRCYHAEFGTSLKNCEAEVSPIAVMTKNSFRNAAARSSGDKPISSVVSRPREKPGSSLAQQVSNGWITQGPTTGGPEMPILLIDDKRELESTFQSGVVGVHFQFATNHAPNISADVDQVELDQLVAIAITSSTASDPIVVMELGSLDQTRVVARLKTLLSNPKLVKVMHDVHRAAFWFYCNGLHDAILTNCVDVQLLYEVAIDTAVLHGGILQIATHCLPNPSETLMQTMHSFKARMKPVDAAEWLSLPLAKKLLQTLAQTAKLYAQCYAEVSTIVSSSELSAMTSARWQNAIENHGRKAIWFDPAEDNTARSLKCLVPNVPAPSQIELLSLDLQCELEPLLDLLPIEYQQTILEIDNYRTKLVDVCLDVGRIPYVYTGKKQRVVLSKNGDTMSKDTIDEILANLGGEMRIGDDNRAGIDRQLHRISVMRSKTDEVYGLTMRVGRALRNAACVLTDLLLSERHADKSVLVLGHPGSGKTTLIRDVARCVSETMENVCIIDTSNEIGGDGLVPHECVGWARRMMVRSLEAQAGVMVECVQNHTVETLIVDEIGRRAEVLAASTVRQRGPRLIASAHGDFRALMKNPNLKGLVGGSQQVILGDGAAAKLATKSKVQTQRAGNPIFDVIVELDHVVRGRCRIIWDVAKAVDSVFEGSGYSFETRQWDASTHGVQVLGLY